MKKVLIYCQASYGVGDLVMAKRLSEELNSNFEVHVVYGGKRQNIKFPDNVELYQMPALFDSNNRLDLEGDYDLEIIKKSRIDILLKSLKFIAPDIVVVQHHPFGRRNFDFELISFLERAKKDNCLIAASYRGVLGRNPDEKSIDYLLDKYYRYILVHQENLDIMKREFSAMFMKKHSSKMIASGFLQGQTLSLEPDTSYDLVVSVGGGKDSEDFVKRLHFILKGTKYNCLFLVKKYVGVYSNLTYKPYSENNLKYILGAKLNISFGGYNSVVDSVRSSGFSIVFPRVENGVSNQEHFLNCKSFEKLGLRCFGQEVSDEEILRTIDGLIGETFEGVDSRSIKKPEPIFLKSSMLDSMKYLSNIQRLKIEDYFFDLYPDLDVKRPLIINYVGRLSQKFYTEWCERLRRVLVRFVEEGFEILNINDIVSYILDVEYGSSNKSSDISYANNYPDKIFVELTRNCNSRCIMCSRVNDENLCKGGAEFDMNFDLFKKIIDQVGSEAKAVDLRGFGESSLFPEFERAVDYCTKYDLSLELISNFTVRDDNLWISVFKNGLKVGISIDGGEKGLYEKIRVNSSYENLLHNLALAKNHGFSKSCYFLVAVQKLNYKSLKEIVELAKKNGISKVELNPVSTTGFSIYDVDERDLFDELTGVYEFSKKVGVDLIISGYFVDLPFLSDMGIKNKFRCERPWKYLQVNYLGEIGPCDHKLNPSITFGNMKECEFEDLWNSFKYRLFRRVIDTNHRMEGCNWCYGNRYY